jgi:hypothetical protein
MSIQILQSWFNHFHPGNLISINKNKRFKKSTFFQDFKKINQTLKKYLNNGEVIKKSEMNLMNKTFFKILTWNLFQQVSIYQLLCFRILTFLKDDDNLEFKNYFLDSIQKSKFEKETQYKISNKEQNFISNQ